MTANTELGAYGIMYVIKNKKNEVISLLLKNGVDIPINATNLQIGVIVTDLLKSSKSFYKDFSKLLLTQDVVVGMSSNMNGSFSNFTGDELFEPNKIVPTNTKDTQIKKTGFFNNALDVLQTGFQGYLQLDDNKTKRALADASVQISETTPQGTVNEVKTGMSTGAIVGLSLLGIAVIGAIAYVIIKKKKNGIV